MKTTALACVLAAGLAVAACGDTTTERSLTGGAGGAAAGAILGALLALGRQPALAPA